MSTNQGEDNPKPHRPYVHVQLPKSIRLPHDAYGNTETAFHLVIRAMEGSAPFRDAQLGQAIWATVQEQIQRRTVRVFAACLMPDHLHLVMAPLSQDILKWANSFKSFTTRLSWEFRTQSALWQPSFYDRRLRDEAEFEGAILYVVNNPVDAGLVESPGEWPWVGSWLDG